MVANYLTGTAFMLIVLLILFIKICNDMKQEKIKRMYQILDVVVALYVLLDAMFAASLLLRLQQNSGTPPNRVSVFHRLRDHAICGSCLCEVMWKPRMDAYSGFWKSFR